MRAAFGLLALVMGVSGCASAPSAPQLARLSPAFAISDPCHAQVRPDWSLRRRIVHLSACEWRAWGEQRLLLDRGWPEAQVEFGPDEDSLSMWTRVGAYWEAADPRHAADARAAAARVGDRELWPAWRRPWSAAFVSWVMQGAGATDFRPDPSHADYLRAALERRPESVIDLAAYTPVVGDLICAGRGSGPRTADEFLRRLREDREFFPAHCDVIAEVRSDAVTLIGGNVKNAVVATVTSVVDGRIPPATTRPWAVALRLAEPPDPCAALQPGPGCTP